MSLNMSFSQVRYFSPHAGFKTDLWSGPVRGLVSLVRLPKLKLM